MKKYTPQKIQILKNLNYKEHCRDLVSGEVLWTVRCPKNHRDILNDEVYIEWKGKKIRLEKNEYQIIL